MSIFDTLLHTTTTNCDGFFISSRDSLRYLTQYNGFSDHERDAFIFVTKKSSTLFTNALYETELIKHNNVFTISLIRGLSNLHEQLVTIIQEERLEKIGFEPSDLTVSEWKTIIGRSFPSIGISLDRLRETKSPEEISYIRKASKIADQALKTILTEIRVGMTELDLQFLLELEIRRNNAQIAFPTIIAFGEHSAVPHHLSGDAKLKKNDTILIDFGARVYGYNSDMTRTFFIGEQSLEVQHLYEAVLTSQKKAVSYITSLLTKSQTIYASDVDAVSRDYLIESGYPPIPHSLGHGIGLAVHEYPSLSPRSKDTLQEGMVFSIEPGIYFPEQGGIRIEDLYAISGGKLKTLTHFPSNFRIL